MIEKKKKRLLSLDVFRGATIAAMILVNDPGSWDDVYTQLLHAKWHGWTITDWIFPFFLFIVGVSMTLSFSARIARGDDKSKLIYHTIRRSFILFILGMIINTFPFGLLPGSHFSFETMRIPGVLQRIAICYLISSIIFLNSSWRGQLIWVLGLLASYWALLAFVPVPEFGSGVLEPKGNLAWYIDSKLLGGHTWEYAPTAGFDPEGILSTIPAIASTLLGILTGHWLRSKRSDEDKIISMLVIGQLLLLVGVIWDQWLPINKNLWTSSYVLFTTGWALIILGTIYWMIDVKGWKGWTKPFTIFGMNAITVFMISELVAILLWNIVWQGSGPHPVTLHDWLYQLLFTPLLGAKMASLLFAIVFTGLMYLVAWGMWKKKWFVKI